ncbi:MAG: NADH-quinone oxidoreductase subunit K, partial [Anaerolineae bacterium]
KGLILAVATAGYAGGAPALGQSIALAILVADAIIIAIGLALIVQIQQRLGTLDIADLTVLRR